MIWFLLGLGYMASAMALDDYLCARRRRKLIRDIEADYARMRETVNSLNMMHEAQSEAAKWNQKRLLLPAVPCD